MMISNHTVVVVPTYNEKQNIIPLLRAILNTEKRIKKTHLSILVVDDSSPDGTGDLVQAFRKKHKNIHLLSGHKAGLGVAYMRGFQYALYMLHADIVVQIDADFSHDPDDIPRLVERAHASNAYVIGSRYIAHGSIPPEWPFHRVIISKIANFFARRIAGLGPVHDCTGGFKAINAQLLRQIDLHAIGANGYSFQMNLLHEAKKYQADIIELPIHFIDRTHGTSKMRFFDIAEFMVNVVKIRLSPLAPTVSYIGSHIKQMAYGITISIGIILGYLVFADIVMLKTLGLIFFFLLSIVITIQSLFTLIGMMYAWETPKRVDYNRSPKEYLPSEYSFTALIPALHEKVVIGDTLRAIAAIDYPEELKEVIVICRADDIETISAARQAIHDLHNLNIRLLIPDFTPRNKADKLNFGLRNAHNEVVCVFDAEDTPHRDIYQVVNTVMIRDQADVVQSGVQLVNFRSNWFSTLNVLEYFFWFKSVLHFFAKQEVIPLGGNTVFFKKDWLHRVDGWDVDCLTEDAEIGIKLSVAGAKIRIIYDELHATQEETPTTSQSFIKQRTRWNQGFLQVYKKREWKRLPKFSQRLLVGYILLWPEIQAFLFLYIVVSLVMIFTVKMPILFTLLSMLPIYILILHVVVLNVGLYEFAKKYRMPYPIWMPLKVLVTFIPFQLVLGVSSLRAVYRTMLKQNAWEKTEHVNAHRLSPKPSSSLYVQF